MNAPKLAALTALAALALPAVARPCDDHDRPAPVAAYPAPVVYRPVPAPLPAGAWVPERGEHRSGPGPAYRQAGWREHERAELRAEYARLDAERNAFHARWAFHPRKLVRYDRWYAAQRAELDQRWQRLNVYAWR